MFYLCNIILLSNCPLFEIIVTQIKLSFHYGGLIVTSIAITGLKLYQNDVAVVFKVQFIRIGSAVHPSLDSLRTAFAVFR